MKYLIDTDWMVDHLNNIEAVTKRLEELAPEGLAISIISLAELYEGVYYGRDPVKSEQLLEEFLAPDLTVLSVDTDICKVFAKKRGRLRQQKRDVSDFDLLIASSAMHYNLTLLTNNRKHFEGIEGLKILSI